MLKQPQDVAAGQDERVHAHVEDESPRKRLPYTKPTLTEHGDIRALTAHSPVIHGPHSHGPGGPPASPFS